MAFEDRGFLSPDIEHWIKKHRAENRAWFDLAEDLNRVACPLLPKLVVPPGDNQMFLAAVLFIRGLSNFQGAILLVERGMSAEARTLTRGSFESAFCLGAVCKDPAFADKFIRDDAARRRKMATALLSLPDDGSSGLEPAHREKLERFLERQAASGIQSEPLIVAEAATVAGVAGVYDMFYRGLSNDAAHVSVTALNRHVQANAKGEVTGLKFSPDVSDIVDSLGAACTACIYLITWTRDKFVPNVANEEFDRCWATYKVLIHQLDPSAPIKAG
jgi:hypothetical protein